eukprot:SM000020S06065  [mRNA]  locus=s20:810243:814519:- [translate_table: standard]
MAAVASQAAPATAAAAVTSSSGRMPEGLSTLGSTAGTFCRDRWRQRVCLQELHACSVATPPLAVAAETRAGAPETARAVDARAGSDKRQQQQQQRRRRTTLAAVTSGDASRHALHCTASSAAGPADGGDGGLPLTAHAIAAAVSVASATPLKVLWRAPGPAPGRDDTFSVPSEDFVALCHAQLALASSLVGVNVHWTVYVRMPESYTLGHLELQRVASHPKPRPDWAQEKVLVLAGDIDGAVSSRLVETALVGHEAVELPECRTLVLPMAKDSFLVGLIVAERILPQVQSGGGVTKSAALKVVRPVWPPKSSVPVPDGGKASISAGGEKGSQGLGLQSLPKMAKIPIFTAEEQRRAADVARTLAMACVIDQRALLLQANSWQRNVVLDGLLEQVRSPLTSLRTLGKMLLPQLKGGELANDMVDDILVQGDRMAEVLQQLQKALYPTQVVEGVGSRQASAREPLLQHGTQCEPPRQQRLRGYQGLGSKQCLLKELRDEELPMPPYALTPLLAPNGGQTCDVASIVAELVLAAGGLAQLRQLALEHVPVPLGVLPLVAGNAFDVRQALSNVIDISLQYTASGGWLKVVVSAAPGGGVLVVVEDNGPGMSLVMQVGATAPLGGGVRGLQASTAEGCVQALNGLSIARNTVEVLGGVMRVQSPHLLDAPAGFGGTRVEIWLPAAVVLKPHDEMVAVKREAAPQSV